MKFFVMIMAGMVLVGCGSPSVQLTLPAPPTSIGIGVIIDSGVSARGKATVHSQLLFRFAQNEPVNLLEEITLAAPKAGEPRKWYRVQVPLDAGLWVHHQFLHNQRIVTIVGNDGKPSPHTYASVKPDRLNVRGGAGDAFPVLGQLPQGTDVALTGAQKGKWLEIFAPGNCSVYVASQFVMRTNGDMQISKLSYKELIKLASQGDGIAQFGLGEVLEEAEDYEPAFFLYKKLAQKGNVNAQLKVGLFYEYGYGRGVNNVKAAEWYEKAALQGHAQAQLWLATLLADFSQLHLAKEWAQKSADQGNLYAKNFLPSLTVKIIEEELLYAKGETEAQKARLEEKKAKLKRLESLPRLPENLVDIKITKGNFKDAIIGKLKKYERARDNIPNVDFDSEVELNQYVKDIETFVRATKNQDFSDCPPEFIRAYLDAVNQHANMEPIYKLRPNMGNFLADIVLTFFSLGSDPSFLEAALAGGNIGAKHGLEIEDWSKKVLKQKIKIRKAFERLKDIAILHGVTYR